jgi:hypothetical protein
MFVVPIENRLITSLTEGNRYPVTTPTDMAIKIHRVRYLSIKFRVFEALFFI